jgi:death-on-curing protein
MAQSGGAAGIRDLNALESVLAQPRATYDGEDLYPTLAAKAAILGFLLLNGYELQAEVDAQEAVILSVAAGQLQRDEFTDWLTDHLTPFG